MTIYTKQYLLDIIQKFYALHGRTPTINDLNVRREIYRNHFGSFGSAVASLGLSINKQPLEPATCDHCTTVYKPSSKLQRFCSQSCSAKHINPTRTRTKITDLQSTAQAREIIGPYSKLYNCACQHCGTKSLLNRRRAYCLQCVSYYSTPARDRYRFQFNVYNYPDLFDLERIEAIGWYKGSHTPEDLAKLTRDHKVSVKDAIKNNYPAFYITHPINCQIMTFTENRKKNRASSIAFSDLVVAVDDYEFTCRMRESNPSKHSYQECSLPLA